jgi:hypothetical protein
MYGCDTSEIPALPQGCVAHLKHYEHVDAEDLRMVNGFIAVFIEKCQGSGRLMLNIFGGMIQDFEPTSRVSKPKKKKSA